MRRKPKMDSHVGLGDESGLRSDTVFESGHGQTQTFEAAVKSVPKLLDHLVGAHEDQLRDRSARSRRARS